jgi:hypothetical protein
MLTRELIQDNLEADEMPQVIDSINYAIFFIGASNDDNFNENEKRRHLFRLRWLIELLNNIEYK